MQKDNTGLKLKLSEPLVFIITDNLYKDFLFELLHITNQEFFGLCIFIISHKDVKQLRDQCARWISYMVIEVVNQKT